GDLTTVGSFDSSTVNGPGKLINVQAGDGIRSLYVTGVQTGALAILLAVGTVSVNGVLTTGTGSEIDILEGNNIGGSSLTVAGGRSEERRVGKGGRCG